MCRYIQCHNYVTKKYDNKSGILVIFIILSVSIILSPPLSFQLTEEFDNDIADDGLDF